MLGFSLLLSYSFLNFGSVHPVRVKRSTFACRTNPSFDFVVKTSVLCAIVFSSRRFCKLVILQVQVLVHIYLECHPQSLPLCFSELIDFGAAFLPEHLGVIASDLGFLHVQTHRLSCSHSSAGSIDVELVKNAKAQSRQAMSKIACLIRSPLEFFLSLSLSQVTDRPGSGPRLRPRRIASRSVCCPRY